MILNMANHMKNILKILPFFILPLLSAGCGPMYTTAVDQIYTTAVDRRDVNTIYSDTTVKLTIINKFYDDESLNALNSLDLSVACYRGHVYLIGEYDTPVQKTRAIKIVESIEGVKGLTTYLLPKKKNGLCGIDENLVIAGKIKAKLIGDKDIWSTNIDVKSVQCHVVLYGLVASKNKINKAIDHAKSVEGVLSVTSFLTSAR